MILNFTIPGAVPSKKNNYRIGRGKLFSPQEVTDYADRFCWQFKKGHMQHKIILSKVCLRIVFYYHHDKDIDNMLTTVMDALQFSRIIKNDKQVVQVLADKTKLKTGEQAYVDISLTTL